jgi:hypothetical protein
MSKETVADALNRVAKWRGVLAGWQLGTRAKGDPESDAVRDHREATILLRVEVTALTGLLLEKGLITQEELQNAYEGEANFLNDTYVYVGVVDEGLAQPDAARP